MILWTLLIRTGRQANTTLSPVSRPLSRTAPILATGISPLSLVPWKHHWKNIFLNFPRPTGQMIFILLTRGVYIFSFLWYFQKWMYGFFDIPIIFCRIYGNFYEKLEKKCNFPKKSRPAGRMIFIFFVGCVEIRSLDLHRKLCMCLLIFQ